MNNHKSDIAKSGSHHKSSSSHVSDPTIKGYILNINKDLNNLKEEVLEEEKVAGNVQNEGKGLFEYYKQQIEDVKKKIKVNLDKAKEEIQIHVKKQDANNARIERHIKQLKLDNAELQKNLQEKKKRLDVLQNIIGPDELLTVNNNKPNSHKNVEKNKK
jgi:hypothetical protein